MNKIKSLTVLSLVTGMDFFLLYSSKFFLGDSINRVPVRGVILTSFYFLLFLIASNVILLFFNDKIFQLWLKKFMIWFIPLAVLLIATGSVEVNYGWPTRTDLAIFVGTIMVVTTLLFALVQRFYYKAL